MYHLHLPYVTDEDNAQYMCVAVNNGGRAVSKAELYVVERGKSERRRGLFDSINGKKK